MNTTKIKNIEHLVSTLNVLREQKKGTDMTCQEVAEISKSLPHMYGRHGILAKHGILIKTDKRHYQFCEKPIYYMQLQAALNEADATAKNIYHKYQNGKKQPEVKSNVDFESFVKENNISLDTIAQYLVKTGNYQISKKIVTWKELY